MYKIVFYIAEIEKIAEVLHKNFQVIFYLMNWLKLKVLSTKGIPKVFSDRMHSRFMPWFKHLSNLNVPGICRLAKKQNLDFGLNNDFTIVVITIRTDRIL